MHYADKYILMKGWVEENIVDVSDLLVLMELTIEDLVMVFPDRLVECYEKVYGADEEAEIGSGETWQEEEGSYLDEYEE